MTDFVPLHDFARTYKGICDHLKVSYPFTFVNVVGVLQRRESTWQEMLACCRSEGMLELLRVCDGVETSEDAEINRWSDRIMSQEGLARADCFIEAWMYLVRKQRPLDVTPTAQGTPEIQ